MVKELRLPRIGGVYRERNWRKIVGDLKRGPSFGIHGTRNENLQNILESQPPYSAEGHYFLVGDQEKCLPDSEFYRRLWESVKVTSNFSYDVYFQGSIPIFSGNPSLLMGIEENNSGAVSSRSKGPFEQSHETFRIGHDFLWSPGYLRLEGITIDERELGLIKMKNFNYYGGVRHYDLLTRAFFLEREVIRGLMKKIHGKIQETQG